MTIGRPTKYKPEYAQQASELCARGATDAVMADHFGVAISTLRLWAHTYKEFSSAIKIAKSVADERVEQSLYKRAMGYEHDETDIRVVDGAIVETQIRKVYPPDSTAMIFWLKNRKPKEWRDKVEQVVSVSPETAKLLSDAADLMGKIKG